MIHDTWYMIHDTWYMIHDTRYMIHDIWYIHGCNDRIIITRQRGDISLTLQIHFYNQTNPILHCSKSSFTLWQIHLRDKAGWHNALQLLQWSDYNHHSPEEEQVQETFWTFGFTIFLLLKRWWQWWINCPRWPFIKCRFWEMVHATIFHWKSQITFLLSAQFIWYLHFSTQI